MLVSFEEEGERKKVIETWGLGLRKMIMMGDNTIANQTFSTSLRRKQLEELSNKLLNKSKTLKMSIEHKFQYDNSNNFYSFSALQIQDLLAYNLQ